MEVKKAVITPIETKEYLSKNGIPQLFECLMTGLMYHRPTDYLNYLQECLEKVKRQGVSGVRWDLFLETRPLSPTPIMGKKVQDTKSMYEPLAGLDTLKIRIRNNASIICVLGGPGVNKTSYSQGLINHYPTFVHLSMGDLLRNRSKIEAEKKGSKWMGSVAQINSGELLPQEMVVESLIWSMNQHADASGFIIDGYPRTQLQYEELKNQIGLENLACIFLVDATEDFCKKQLHERGQTDDFWLDHDPAALETRICRFKLQTLPMCKCVDADGKLRVIDGEIKPEHIARDLKTVCEYVLSGKVTGPSTRPTPGSIPDRPLDRVSHGMMGCPGQPPVFNIPRIVPVFTDKGRVADLPTCPVILVFGGPGAGRTEQAKILCERLPGLKHFNVTDFLRHRVLDQIDGDSQKDWDVVARRVHSSDPPMSKDRIIPEYWDVQVDILRQEFNTVADNTRAVVIEGFPNDENQLNIFNQHIGGADLAILLDCEENTLQRRILKRYTRLSRIEDEEAVALHRILFFKHCTLPVIRHYDERSILVTHETQGNNNSTASAQVSRSQSVVPVEDKMEEEAMKEEGEQKSPSEMNNANESPSIENAKVICLAGDPQSGKTTQGRRIAEHFGYTYCSYDKSSSVKDTLRNLIFGDTELFNGVVLDDFPDELQSEMLPNKVVLNFVKETASPEERCEPEEADDETTESTEKKQSDEAENLSVEESHKQPVSDAGQVYKINASGTIDSVFNDICSLLTVSNPDVADSSTDA